MHFLCQPNKQTTTREKAPPNSAPLESISSCLHQLAQILPFWCERAFQQGRVKQIEQDSKMFKNRQLSYFWMRWTHPLSVNLSASDMHLAGVAS